MFVLLVVLVLLAVPRAARLVTADKITEPIRDRIARVVRDEQGAQTACGRPKLLYFITCPWCTSIWLGGGAASLVVLWPDGIDGGPMDKVVLALMLLGAASELSGFAAMAEAKLDAETKLLNDTAEPDHEGA